MSEVSAEDRRWRCESWIEELGDHTDNLSLRWTGLDEWATVRSIKLGFSTITFLSAQTEDVTQVQEIEEFKRNLWNNLEWKYYNDNVFESMSAWKHQDFEDQMFLWETHTSFFYFFYSTLNNLIKMLHALSGPA